MPYKLELRGRASRELDRITRSASPADRQNILEALDQLERNPYPTNPDAPPGAIRKLDGDLWRYRASRRYRIVYTVAGMQVTVLRIDHRRDVYRGL